MIFSEMVIIQSNSHCFNSTGVYNNLIALSLNVQKIGNKLCSSPGSATAEPLDKTSVLLHVAEENLENIL